MMTRNVPLPAPRGPSGQAQVAPVDLRETRMGAPFAHAAPQGPPLRPHPTPFPRGVTPVPSRSGPFAALPAEDTYASGNHPHANANANANANAYAPAPVYAPPPPPHASAYGSSPAPLPAPSTSVSLPPKPTAPPTQKPRLAVLALGGACLLIAAGVLLVNGAAANAPPKTAKRSPAAASPASSPSTPATTAAVIPGAGAAVLAADVPSTKTPAAPATGLPGAHAAPAPPPSTTTPTARTPIEKRDVLAERRIAKALLTGDANGATTEADALAAAHPEIGEYRTMRRALRRMTPPSSAD